MLKITKIIFQGFECKKINKMYKFSVIHMIDENSKEYIIDGKELENWIKDWNIFGVVLKGDGSIFYLYVPNNAYNYIDSIEITERFEDKYVFTNDVWFNSSQVIFYLQEEYYSFDGYSYISDSTILTLNEILDTIFETDSSAFACRKELYIQEYSGTTFKIIYNSRLAAYYAKRSVLCKS